MQLYDAVKELKRFQEQSELKFQFKIGIEGIYYQKPTNFKVCVCPDFRDRAKAICLFHSETSGK